MSRAIVLRCPDGKHARLWLALPISISELVRISKRRCPVCLARWAVFSPGEDTPPGEPRVPEPSPQI